MDPASSCAPAAAPASHLPHGRQQHPSDDIYLSSHHALYLSINQLIDHSVSASYIPFCCINSGKYHHYTKVLLPSQCPRRSCIASSPAAVGRLRCVPPHSTPTAGPAAGCLAWVRWQLCHIASSFLRYRTAAAAILYPFLHQIMLERIWSSSHLYHQRGGLCLF